MNFSLIIPKKLHKALKSFPPNEKETPSEYSQRLEKHLKTSKENVNLLKLYEFLAIIEKRKGDKMDTDKMALLEKELVPKNENLYKPKRKRNIQHLAREGSFEIINPFLNATSLVKFYRFMLKKDHPEAAFEECSFETDCRFAAQILDDLALNKRDEKFLRMWIYNYIADSLKGDNITKTEKTSISAFKKTFVSFNANYYG